MSEKMKNLAVRTVSGIVLCVVMLGAIWWSQWSFGLFLALLLVGGMLEFYNLAEKRGAAPQRLIGLVAGLMLFVLNFVLITTEVDVLHAGFARSLYGYGMAFALLLLPLMFFCELWRKKENPAGNIGVTLMAIFYVALPFSLMCYFPIIATETWNPFVMFGYIFIVWVNDVFAYLVGMTIGRHRMFERISPKKSWEGFFGGVFGAVIMGVVVAHLLGANLCAWGVMALIISITSVLGDLVESMFKRAADVKDSGALIPGHGGVLDRFDAMLLSAPFVFVYMIMVM